MRDSSNNSHVPAPHRLARPMQSSAVHSVGSETSGYIPTDLRAQIELFQQHLTGPSSAHDIYSSWQTLERTLTPPQRLLLMVAWNQYMKHKDPAIITDAVDKLLQEIEGC